ncbi:hypothetical protein JHK87_034158 [Glycine soja]|nr:hypothetical protein JHK87_034158 [Glycine soja]
MALFSASATVLPQNLAFTSSTNLFPSHSHSLLHFFLSFSTPKSSNPRNCIAISLQTTHVQSGVCTSFYNLCYVVSDNIDTNQIIPAEYLTLVPSKPDEYEKFGSYTLTGIPATYPMRFVDLGEANTKYAIVIGSSNFGRGSSHEHAPMALSASSTTIVFAESLELEVSDGDGACLVLLHANPSSSCLLVSKRSIGISA